MSTALISQPTTSLPAWMAGIAGALPDAIASAKTIIEAGFAPKDCKGPQSIVVAVAMGARLGLDPFTAIYGIAVVNGKPSLYGDALLAVCQNHPQWEDFTEKWTGEKYREDFTAHCTVKRKGREPYTVTFCVKDAQHAGLWEKQGPWKNTPQRMLMMRARAFALRGAFADALAGFHSREEMEDVETIDVTATATVHDEPKPAKVRRETVKQAKEAEKAPEAKVETETANDDKEPVVIEGADEPPKPITIADCITQATELFKTEAGKGLLRDHLKRWSLTKVQDLGELPPEEVTKYHNDLAATVAEHIRIKGPLK